MPAAPRSRQAELDLCLTALSGPPLKTAEGWGHCAEASWPRQPYADQASTVWRLTGQIPSLPRLVPGGSHIVNDSIYFLTGRAGEWLNMRSAGARGIIAEQKPDGSFRYDGKFRRGHFEDTASGYCAARAVQLLEHARLTGDAASLQAGVKALEFMKHFRDPRGAQTWEVPLHTPDILASAFLVHAYVRGYELTGQRDYLDRARAWAITGLPFVYQWSDEPTMAYATIAVFGATGWQAPNWMGLPVQWCGYDYAYALTMLAPLDHAMDWKRIATGILTTAEQMQYPVRPIRRVRTGFVQSCQSTTQRPRHQPLRPRQPASGAGRQTRFPRRRHRRRPPRRRPISRDHSRRPGPHPSPRRRRLPGRRGRRRIVQVQFRGDDSIPLAAK